MDHCTICAEACRRCAEAAKRCSRSDRSLAGPLREIGDHREKLGWVPPASRCASENRLASRGADPQSAQMPSTRAPAHHRPPRARVGARA
jgi:hypothetical protein